MPMEKEGLIFGHDVHLSATGGVARQAVELGKAAGYGAPLTCDNCHRRADDGGFVPVEMKRDCGQCHSLAFTRKNGVDQLLPHGHPDQVVAALKAYFANGPHQSGGTDAFLGRPGMHGVFVPSQPVDYVAANVRDAFEPGGTCYGCHVIIPPADKRSLNYGVAPVKLTSRYLPWGDFNHNVPEHHQDANGAPNCETCHKAKSSTKAEEVHAAQDRRMRHLPWQDQAGNPGRGRQRLRGMPRFPQSGPGGIAQKSRTRAQRSDPDTVASRIYPAPFAARGPDFRFSKGLGRETCELWTWITCLPSPRSQTCISPTAANPRTGPETRPGCARRLSAINQLKPAAGGHRGDRRSGGPGPARRI